MIAQSVASMKPSLVSVRAQQRLPRANVHWNVRSAKLNGIQGITCGLLDIYVPSDHRDRSHPDIRGAKSHDQRNSIVGSSVGID